MEKLSNVLIVEDKSPKGLKKFIPKNLLSFRSLYFVLIAIIIFEVGLGIKTLLTPLPKKQQASLQPITSGKIALSSENSQYKVGDRVSVDVKVFSGGHSTVGTDLSLRYDPQYLEATGSATFQRGGIYREFLGVEIDSANGLINISGISASDQDPFNSLGIFGTVNFTARRAGQTNLAVEYAKDSTIDSNIVEAGSGNDILGEVYNLSLNISNDTSSTRSTSSQNRCEGFIQVCQDSVGNQGTQRCVGGKLNQNKCVWDAELTLTCESCQIN